MKIQAIVVLSFVAFCVEGRRTATHIASPPVPDSVRRYLAPELDCLLDRQPCNSNTEITKHALSSYLQGNTSHFLINQRIRVNTVFRNIKEFYPNEWRTIKSNYERTLDARQKSELDNALTRKVLADYPIDDLTREIMKCFLEDECNLIVPNLKIKMYEMAAYGRCSECTDSTMEWLFNIQNKLEQDQSDNFTRAIIAKERSFEKITQEKRIFECLQYPSQTALDCIQAILLSPV
ncbi:GSCOCG00006400001-RA-CDS [Cotesia congregata]|nr:GSCOCG00006400001-RA-CDS [Cotesia congregata]